MKQLRKSTVIECVASTPDRDVTNESLDIHGADISPLLEGRGFVNSDHRQNFESMVGRVLSAKKILKAEDCETPSQMKFFKELSGKPFIWCKAELWDGVGHKEADAIASIYKFFMAKNEPTPVKVSVEGKTLERGKDGQLKRTLIKGIALTVHPCNRTTRTEVVQITKNNGARHDLVKSEDAAIPSFYEVKENPLDKILQLAVVARQLLRSAKDLKKSNVDKGFELKSPKLLEQLKAKISDFKKSE